MLKRVIHGCNLVVGAPPDWDATKSGPCLGLPIRIFPPAAVSGEAPVEFVESAWEPTPQELAQLNAGASVILRIVGWQVPVALYVEMPAEKAAEDVG